MTTLMERKSGDWLIELRLVEGKPEIMLQRGEDAEPQNMLVPADKAMDAFLHPVCYLPKPEYRLSRDLHARLEGYSLKV